MTRVVGAVCHGPAALVNIKLSSGQYLVAGHEVSAFSNEEERTVKLDKVVPFLLQDQLVARGAVYREAPLWQSQVVASERLVTGQNPASAKGVVGTGRNGVQDRSPGSTLDMPVLINSMLLRTPDSELLALVQQERSIDLLRVTLDIPARDTAIFEVLFPAVDHAHD